MSDDDRPTLRVGDHVIDREDDEAPDASVMLVVELTLERADAVFIERRRRLPT